MLIEARPCRTSRGYLRGMTCCCGVACESVCAMVARAEACSWSCLSRLCNSRSEKGKAPFSSNILSEICPMRKSSSRNSLDDVRSTGEEGDSMMLMSTSALRTSSGV